MKIIHSSDWHIGHTFFDYDRLDEHISVLDRLAEIAEAECPDAMVVSGDIFHSYMPAGKARRLFVEKIDAMHRRVPSMHIIITAGNHDNAAYHEVFATPWLRDGVHLIGTMPANPADAIVELPGCGFIAAVPYISARRLGNVYSEIGAAIAERNSAGLPVVFMGHLAVSGCRSTGHDSDDFTIGNIDCLPLSVLGDDCYDYVALGHIHGPQTFAGGRVRYSGSLLPVSFDEVWQHTVSIVEIGHRGDLPVIREVPIEPDYEVVTLEGDWNSAIAALRDFDPDRRAYVRLKVTQEAPLPLDADRQARDICLNTAARFCNITYCPVTSAERSDAPEAMSVNDFDAATPLDIARRYIATRGAAISDDQLALLQEVINSVNEDDRL